MDTHTHTHRRRTHHKHNIMQRKKKIRCSLACSARQALCCCSELALRDSSRSLSIMKHWLCSPLSAPSSSCCLATAPDSSVTMATSCSMTWEALVTAVGVAEGAGSLERGRAGGTRGRGCCWIEGAPVIIRAAGAESAVAVELLADSELLHTYTHTTHMYNNA